jgi:rubrerythrin
MNCKKLIIFTLILLFSCPFGLKQTVGEEIRKADYYQTISALQQLYNAKIMGSNTYSELARKALQKRYFSVASLFSALSESESVHARNFINILNDLGVGMKDLPKPDIKISDTKDNLEFSLAVELSTIDTYYPKLIKRIKPEGNESALEDITYAWKAETQHRDLIINMKSSLWPPLGKIVDNLKEAHEYHVCQRCGSTVFNLPEKSCIICGSPLSIYKRIKSQAMFDFVDSNTNKPDRSTDFVVFSQKREPPQLKAVQNMQEPFRLKPVPRMDEWFITFFTLNPIIFAKKAHLAYEPTGLEGSMLTHYIEKELKLRINTDIPVKVGKVFPELKNKKSINNRNYFIFCISGEIQDLLITSKKSETWGVLKVKYIFSEQQINSSYISRETKQIQIIPSDNSTDNTPEALLVHKNLTRDDMEKLLQNSAKEIVNRVVLKLPSFQ